MLPDRIKSLLCVFFGALLICGSSTVAWGRVRLANICSIQGQQEIKLTGMGIVVGLPGTGDGAKNETTVRMTATALQKLNHPSLISDIKNADNVAVVLIEATVPKSGIRRGQKIDGYISSPFGAKNLRGGRLLVTPLTALDNRTAPVALASGAISIEDIKLPTSGRMVLGVEMLRDVTAQFVKSDQDQVFTLLIEPAKASFWTSSEIASVVNTEFSFESNNEKIARPVGPGAVEVSIPVTYQKQPVEFIAQVLEVGIEAPHTQARVVLNSTSKTVVVTGEVEISPVIITHKSFTIEIGEAPSEGPGPFQTLGEGQNGQNPVQLQQLQTALNKLRVPNEDIIAIIRELHASGKLHAEVIDK